MLWKAKVVVLTKRLRKALQGKPLVTQILEDIWDSNKGRWQEKVPSRGPAIIKVSQCPS